MGRKRTTHHDLPPGLHRKRGRYYYGRRMEALGVDLSLALREWARRRGEEVTEAITFTDAARHYRLHALHKVATSTQREYSRQLIRLEKTFGLMALEAIEPYHVKQYLLHSAPIAGTREKALLSIVFNHARENGLTKVQNPCQGIRGTKSRAKTYVTDEQLATVIKAADPELAAFLELLWRTGQDASVVLRLTPQDFAGPTLRIKRPKTGEEICLRTAGLECSVGGLPFVSKLTSLRLRLTVLQHRLGCPRFTFKQLRAKAATDTATDTSLQAAQALLGHADITTTGLYIRRTSGTPVEPITRQLRRS